MCTAGNGKKTTAGKMGLYIASNGEVYYEKYGK